MLRLSVLIHLIILYWCSLYIDRVRCENISRARSSSWFNTKRFFHFDISTLRKLPKSTILLCIVLRCFFSQMHNMWNCRKTSCKFWICEVFLQFRMRSQPLHINIFSCTLFTLYMQNCFYTFFFYSFYTHKVLTTCVLIDGSICIHPVRWATFACVW